jgi:tRNA-Thr(GGU) m(6)t(6)A37 methyltransferase TsaA
VGSTDPMSSSRGYTLLPIGRVHSPLEQLAEAPKQGYEGAPDARVKIDPAYLSGLDGIDADQYVLILTWLHQARRDLLAVHPRDDPGNPLTGVFATRSADRPNPIGVHRVRVLAVESDGLLVQGLEAIDGTPVLDIKPALSRAGGW